MRRAAFSLLAMMIIGVLVVFAVLFYQGRRKPTGTPEYVALGSSYAAGLGIGDRASGSPFACLRGTGGYPPAVARVSGLSLVDMTCSGATAEQVLNGGQYFQNPQVDAVGPATRLVTLTAGGNDVFYIGDLVGMAKANGGGATGWVATRLMRAPHADGERDYRKLEAEMRTLLRVVRARSSGALVVVVSYPPVLPDRGSCSALGLTPDQVASMRPVAARLASLTRSVARTAGVALVDMAGIGIGHDACSREPWTNGSRPMPGDGAAFHPNRSGVAEIARRIVRVSAAPGR